MQCKAIKVVDFVLLVVLTLRFVRAKLIIEMAHFFLHTQHRQCISIARRLYANKEQALKLSGYRRQALVLNVTIAEKNSLITPQRRRFRFNFLGSPLLRNRLD